MFISTLSKRYFAQLRPLRQGPQPAAHWPHAALWASWCGPQNPFWIHIRCARRGNPGLGLSLRPAKWFSSASLKSPFLLQNCGSKDEACEVAHTSSTHGWAFARRPSAVCEQCFAWLPQASCGQAAPAFSLNKCLKISFIILLTLTICFQQNSAKQDVCGPLGGKGWGPLG